MRPPMREAHGTLRPLGAGVVLAKGVERLGQRFVRRWGEYNRGLNLIDPKKARLQTLSLDAAVWCQCRRTSALGGPRAFLMFLRSIPKRHVSKH
jgi:hypothetical protein